MQRRIFNFEPIKPILLLVGLVIYESITSLYIYITPLAGVIFLYLVNNFKDKEKVYINLVLFLYLIYFEIDRGYFLFSSVVLFIIYYNFLHEPIINSIACQSCLKFTIIFLYYVGLYIVNLIFALVFNMELPIFDVTYLIYIMTDFIVVLL